MIESRHDDAIVNLAEAILKTFKKDVNKALKLREPKYKQRELERLRLESERGAMALILNVVGLDFDDIVTTILEGN